MRGPQARNNRRRIRLDYVEDFSDEHDADGHGPFATIARSMSDRLLTRIIHDGHFFRPALHAQEQQISDRSRNTHEFAGLDASRFQRDSINVHGLRLCTLGGSVGMVDGTAILAPLLGNLVGALFLHRLGRFFLGRFLLCHALSHCVSPLLCGWVLLCRDTIAAHISYPIYEKNGMGHVKLFRRLTSLPIHWTACTSPTSCPSTGRCL
jgi:hypothetical protein